MAGRNGHRPVPGHRPESAPRRRALVLVRWRDAWFDFDEPDPEDVRSDYLVSTAGYLVRQTDRFVSVAQEILPDGDGFRAVTHIPTSVVDSIDPLEVVAGAVLAEPAVG